LKLRYIILGAGIFFWATLVVGFLSEWITFDDEMIFGRPVMYFVILGAGVLIGYGLGKE
jgi:hypothetical protein